MPITSAEPRWRRYVVVTARLLWPSCSMITVTSTLAAQVANLWVDRLAEAPLYRQLASILRAGIDSGELEKLPPSHPGPGVRSRPRQRKQGPGAPCATRVDHHPPGLWVVRG